MSAQNGDQQIQHLRALNQHQGELAFEAEPDALREAIEQLDPDELSPKQALAYLYQLKKMLRIKERSKIHCFYDRSFIFTNFLKSHRFQNLFYRDNGWIGFYEWCVIYHGLIRFL